MLTRSERLRYFPDKIDIHEFVDTITLLLNIYDEYTAGHSYRVAYWAEKLSRCFDRPEIEHRRIHIAAHLHDIGKLAVPHEILNKDSPLTTEEFEIIKEHPVKGANLLRHIDTLKYISDIVLYHHERYDGMGYVSGLKGEEIPFDSRIIAVVDSFDAMTSNRPYREALSRERALGEIRAGAGRQFDPFVVEKWFRQGVAAGMDEARVLLAEMYLNGINDMELKRTAVKLLHEAAANGYARGELFLGKIYESGMEEIAVDPAAALAWYCKAAEHGSGEAAYLAGNMLLYGDTLLQDYAQARKMLGLAAQQGKAEAYGILGDIYLEGLGVEKDLYQAEQNYKDGVRRGDSYSCLQLGLFYGDEDNGSPDFQKALRYLQQGAELGNSEAMYILGGIYDMGSEIPQDSHKAMKWYITAAENGNRAAQYRLGSVFEKGLLGQSIDYRKAGEWYQQAAQGADCLRKQHALEKVRELQYVY